MQMQTITLKNGKDYPLYFDFYALEQIQQRYSDIANIFDKLSDLSEIKWLVLLLINEGIDYNNYMHGSQDKGLTEKELGMLMPVRPDFIKDLQQKIIDAFNDSIGATEKKT
jgi:hypothetical protein